jgi:uncharacterized protein
LLEKGLEILGKMKNKIELLENKIAFYRRAIIGFSAGVDSTLVAFAAKKILRKNALIVLARTETIIEEDIELARKLAKKYKFNYEEIEYNELEIENYASNPINRCYYCKSELYSRLLEIAAERNIPYVLDGANVDDLGDYRPGRVAAKENKIHSPLIECGFTKQDVREAAEFYGIPNYDKPSAPCLSSRIPYGTFIDSDSLSMIARAEKFIRSKGFKNVRVRHFNHIAKVEVDSHDVTRIKSLYDEVEYELKAIGYEKIEIDDEGFKSGKLNQAIISQTENV